MEMGHIILAPNCSRGFNSSKMRK